MTATLPDVADRDAGPATPAYVAVHRWLPLAVGLSYVAGVLLVAGTSPLDLVRYVAYILFALILPGTLVYRSLRRRPHTLVEDVAMGAAVGLVLELPAWALFSALDLRGWLWLWPLSVVAVFAAVPRLRRHWVVRGYAATPLGWSWSVAGVVAFFTTYLSYTFLERNPILPSSDETRQYLDLAYQLSLAGEAKHQLPIHVPQVAAEPLNYHWFGYVHMAATSLIGHIDLPVVALRLTIPALCAAAIVLTAVLGWRVSGRPYVGAAAAALFFVIGETNFTHPVTMPFGTQASFVIWHGMSMIYSWVLLIALIAALADVVDRRADRPVAPIGRGAFVLAALLMFASSGAKASSVPVVAVALAITAVALLITERRIPWAVVVAGVLAGAAQLFATAVLYRFQTYGVQLGPFWSFERFWAQPPAGWPRPLVIAAVITAFLINMQLRVVGVVALIRSRRWRLEPVQWFLLAGAVAGPGLYLVLLQSSDGNQYFTRAGFTFGVVISAWGYAMVLERADLDARQKRALAGFAVALAVLLVLTQLSYAGSTSYTTSLDPLMPLLKWSVLLAAAGLVAAAAWLMARRGIPALRGRGAVVALTAVLVVGAPGLIMDMYKSVQTPNGGAYATVPMPLSRIEAARWTREHSSPRDVVATNVHCLAIRDGWCDPRSFWLSAYAERRVLVEGWAFAPRVAALGLGQFWDQELLRRNDEAFTAPTDAGLRELRDRHDVRWLVVDRTVGVEAPELTALARLRFDNGRMAVYELP
ncbi:hypothetical protein [Micromonospora sp. NPDC049679]|uniref:hypothetical protein n=1 Tax=Micromonospora sp. NPDC049679 TaxID=3155920 RepID=UPI0033F5A7EB